MKKIPDWYVITGGPNSGKTTTVEYLSKLGYKIVPEYARMIIDKELAKGKTIKEIRKNPAAFQDKVTKFKIRLENKAPKNKIVFLDRGLPDALAYYRYWKAKVPKELFKLAKNRYRKVFLLDLLPYKKDYARVESGKDVKLIHGLIKKTYEELGYEVVKVPVISVEDRVKFILKYVKT